MLTIRAARWKSLPPEKIPILLDHELRYVRSRTFYTHPEYNDEDILNDICLVQLPEPLIFNEFVSPACLPMQNSEPQVLILKLSEFEI